MSRYREVPVAPVEWDEADGMSSDEETEGQVAEALHALDRPASQYMRWPWEALDGLTGGMAPGDVWFVVAGSSIGKTTLVTSAVDRWRVEERRVYVMPLEVRAKTFRTIMACQALDLKPGEVLSGDIHRWPDAQLHISRIKGELQRQAYAPEFTDFLKIKGVPFINAGTLELAMEDADKFGADIVIVDHIDHIEGGDGSDLYAESVKVNKMALKLAQKYEKLVLFTSQANNAPLQGAKDHLAQYQPLRPNHVFMGNHKRMIATGMVGIFRPVRQRRSDETPEDYMDAIKRCRDGTDEAWKGLEPGVMGVNQMKSRNGKAEGARCFLRVEHGRVNDLPEKDRYATQDHGIRKGTPV